MNKTDSQTLLKNVEALHNKFGNKLNTHEKWIVAYWQQIDRLKIEDGKIAVTDIINNATSPSHIIDTVTLYKVMKQVR
ncbi:hypothetical protein PQE74_gp073 [Bacillus phage vB_BanS_Chewbecca]|uniref:Uncharacterized protein n=1 Tax=Bacillus phage vB_BanS_Chewbecca TaxID=2894786 RepID=A0AAE9CA49_9CAUD|nr:hypothetical protein PQE74_gp073 [Bacillus phage vB_BanS_Chewbecca]UGO46156.1 hypothetical protein CHEWBECCA_73 [Bacillus phage vB_BanS_Chewbecca]